MKKVLGVLLALTLAVGAFAGLTLLSVSAASQPGLVEGKSLVEDFESGQNAYMGSFAGGKAEVKSAAEGAPVHGGEYSLKFSEGSGTWVMAQISSDATQKIVKGQGSTYRLSAWVYFETVASGNKLALLFRGTQGVIHSDRDHVVFPEEATIEPNKWIQVTYTYTLTAEQAADPGLFVCFDKMGGSVYYIDDLTFEKLDNVMGDGTLENNADGWTHLYDGGAGQLERVAGGANGTNWAMKYTPSAGKWTALSFHVGPAIVNDANNNYNGAGAGKYKLSFYAKLADTAPDNTGDFYIFLNSQFHKSDTQVAQLLGKDQADCMATHMNLTAGGLLTFEKEWKKFEIEMEIPEKFLAQLKALMECGKLAPADMVKIYQLVIRFDASEGWYEADDNVPAAKEYLVDELTFEKVTEEQPPEDTSKKVVNGNAENGLTGWTYFEAGGECQPTLVQPGANGTANAVRFAPTSKWQSIAFDLGPAIVQNEAAGYKGMGAGKYMVSFYAKVDGKAPENTKIEMLLNSTVHTTNPEELSKYGVTVQDYHEKTFINGQFISLTDEWKQYTVVFDVSENFLKTLDDLYAVGEKGARAYELMLRFDGGNKDCAFDVNTPFAYLVDEVTIAPAKEAAGVQWSFEKDYSGGVYVCSDAGKGFITEADVKNGKVKKEFTICNNGTQDIQVQFAATVLHTDNENKQSWKPVKNIDWLTIPAGESRLISYECDAEITIDGKKYTFDQYFPRFDIRNGEGKDEIKAGTSMIVAGLNNELLAKLKSNVTPDKGFMMTVVYELPDSANKPGGDVLPVALMAAVAVAAVALVVVAKKKKEQE